MSASGLTVAIDGPAGAGKSTVARAVAEQLGYALVDTGAIYRAVALLARRQAVAWDDDARLGAIARGLSIAFTLTGGVNQVRVDGEDVTDALRAAAISQGASEVSRCPSVRAGLLALQRALAGRGGAVLEGRDIGTVVCPDAAVKFFLDASDTERARRRHEEMRGRGDDVTLAATLAELQARDALDRGRAEAPLRAADDAIRLDSTRMAIAEVIATIVARVRHVAGVDPPPPAMLRPSDAAATAPERDPERFQRSQEPMPSATLNAIFDQQLPQRMAAKADVVAKINSTYKFVIKGDEGGTWLVDLTKPGGAVTAGDGDAKCTITMAAADFVDLMGGKLAPQMAFMGGKLKVAGDMALALKLGSLLG